MTTTGSEKMSVEPSDADRVSLLEGLRGLWQSRQHCDVTLRSQDGTTFEAHRVVLAAASSALAALLSGHFAEGQGSHVQLDTPRGALEVMLGFIYGVRVEILPEDAMHALQLAHMYGLAELQRQLTTVLLGQLRADIALRVLSACELLGLEELEEKCELHAATDFEACAETEAFASLTAAQLGRLLKHHRLSVRREEVVLDAVLRWHRAGKGRDVHMSHLFQHVRFPLMAVSSLRSVEQLAQSLGPCGVELQREARRGLRAHERPDLDGEPLPKRRCLERWWSGLGSSTIGGSPVSQLAARALVLQGGDLFCSDFQNKCILKMPRYGSLEAGRPVAGQGATVKGPNDLSEWFAFHVSLHNGDLLIADHGNSRILRIREGVSEVLGSHGWDIRLPRAVWGDRRGAIYVLEQDGTRVQKIEGDTVQTVAGGNGPGTGNNQFYGTMNGLFVSEAGNIFISDYKNHRIQRWVPGEKEGSTVAGGVAGESPSELMEPRGLFVTADETVYVADYKNHRVVKWCAGASAGSVVAGGYGPGDEVYQLKSPTSVTVDPEGAMYIADLQNSRIMKWGPGPTCQWER